MFFDIIKSIIVFVAIVISFTKMKFKSRLSTLFFKLLLTKKADALLCFKSLKYFKSEKNEISFSFADFNELILVIFKQIFFEKTPLTFSHISLMSYINTIVFI